MWPLNPLEFWEFAKKVANSSEVSDVELRICVGRAYYALFHISKERLIALGRLEEGKDTHENVVSEVKGRKGNLGEKLDALKRLRRQAEYVLSQKHPDYNPRYEDWKNNWNNAQAIANQILPHLQTLS